MGFNPFHLVAWYLVFVFSTTLHEAAHALVSWKLGDATAYQGGQVTLDPRPHMKREPAGMIWVPLISFMVNGWMLGWASTPISGEWGWRYPKRSAWTSFAGPLANLMQATLAFLLIRIGLAIGVFHRPFLTQLIFADHMADASGVWNGVIFLLSIMLTLNLLLFLLNLIPVPPFDGGSVMMLFMDDETARDWMTRMFNRRMIMIALIVAFFGFGYIFRPILALTKSLLYWGVGY